MKILRYITVFLLFYCVLLESIFTQEVNKNDSLYDVNDVFIEYKAEDSYKAKKIAIVNAKKKAFDILIKNISSNFHTKIFTIIDDISTKQLDLLIKSYYIKEEVITKDYYSALIDFKFDYKYLDKLLQKILHEYLPKRSILVIPFLDTESETTVWNSVWYDAWDNLKDDRLLIPVEDIDTFSNLTVNKDNKLVIKPVNLKKYYMVDDIIVANAKIVSDIFDTYVIIDIKTDKGDSLYSLEYLLDKKQKNMNYIFNNIVKNVYNKMYTEFHSPVLKDYINSKVIYNIFIFDKNDRKYMLQKIAKYPYIIRYISNDALVLSVYLEERLPKFIKYLEKNNISVERNKTSLIIKRVK